MRIGIYGGAFNPPHIGHVSGARAALEQLGLDRLLVVPSGTPPHKALPPGSPSAEQRLELARTAFGGVPQTVVTDLEVRRPGESYTADTVRALLREYPGAELVLITGTDMYMTLEKWFEAEFILKNVTLAVTARFTNTALDEFEARYAALGARTLRVRNTAIEISSSELRRELTARHGAEYLDDTVYEYIIKNGLYDAKPEFGWLRLRAYQMLAPERIRHVAGCELEAVRLARRWGADPDEARAAAILHDITKRLTLAEQLALCEKYGLEPDEAERKSEKLLHAKTGAAIAKYEFNANNEISGAILWHTTGRAGMTRLDKLIYMADYIEPNRDFEGLRALRALAYEELDRAIELGLQMSLRDLRARGKIPHPATLGALEFLQTDKGVKI
jgi:nicotinate-nucleotide adenylyltransferase